MSEINAPPTSEAITTLARETAERLLRLGSANSGNYGKPSVVSEAESVIASALASVAQEREEVRDLACERLLSQQIEQTDSCKAECERLRAELAQAHQERDRDWRLIEANHNLAAYFERRTRDERRKTLEEAIAELLPPRMVWNPKHAALCDWVVERLRRLRDLPPVSERSK